jgi:hypothetical protein
MTWMKLDLAFCMRGEHKKERKKKEKKYLQNEMINTHLATSASASDIAASAFAWALVSAVFAICRACFARSRPSCASCN